MKPHSSLGARFLAAPFWLVLAGLLASACSARADVKLPRVISDHAVLQRDMGVPIWGWAEPGEEVTVSVRDQNKSTKAGNDGKWQVKLEKLAAGGPHTLTVKGKNTLTVNDVLVGEVWLASGQSNMQWTVKASRDSDKETAAANFPQIRMFQVPRLPAREPQADCNGKWFVCSPVSVGEFSATAYYFGRDLHQNLGVPVGLVNTSVGGTPIESWTSLEAQRAASQLSGLFGTWDQRVATYDPDKAKAAYEKQLAAYKEAAAKAKAEKTKPPFQPVKPSHPRDSLFYPGNLYNAMVAPLIPYAVRGAIWYQGESNAGSAQSGKLYGVQLPLLIQDWRARWGQGDFPFAWVQLPNFKGERFEGWNEVREAMLQALAIPNTGMAITMDIGDSNDIHPKNKQDVGHRLALWARAKVYGEKVPYSGPLPAGQQVKGNEIVVNFQHADGGLQAKGGELRAFQIAGSDKVWKPATARIDGDKVLVSCAEISQPKFVRYSWANDPGGNLFNGAGLPASPFRTDKD